MVNAPPKEPTGQAGLRLLSERLGSGAVCRECRHRLVIGEGDGSAPIVLFSGQTLVPEADVMLTRMLQRVLRVQRSAAFIIHLNRCPTHFKPGPTDPINDCGALLRAELQVMRPRLMLALGRDASRTLLSPQRQQIQRGRWSDYWIAQQTVPTLVTFHPNFLVHNPEHKGHAFADLKQFRARMDRLQIP